jgi:hypothetical protein
MNDKPQSDQGTVPQPEPGLVVYDPKYPAQRWRLLGTASDGRIEAVRYVPADGAWHSWTPEGWEHAWRSGWLASDEGQS